MFTRYILLVCSIVLLIACGGSGSGSSSDFSDGITATNASIANYRVRGTSSLSLPAMPKQISPYENDGEFTVFYEIDANGVVGLELSLIHTGDSIITCGNESTEFFAKHCGDGELCALDGEISCKFEANNMISCEDGPKTDLTSFFESIPQVVDMVMCVSRRNGGTAQKERVEFR